MAFAPYTNDRRTEGQSAVLGMFTEVTGGRPFEYAANTARHWVNPGDWPHKVFVGPRGEEARYARVLKTVAYVIVDENDDGTPVVEKWKIKGHRAYAAA